MPMMKLVGEDYSQVLVLLDEDDGLSLNFRGRGSYDVSASWPMGSSTVFEGPKRPCQEEAQFSAAVMDVCGLRRTSSMSGACSVC